MIRAALRPRLRALALSMLEHMASRHLPMPMVPTVEGPSSYREAMHALAHGAFVVCLPSVDVDGQPMVHTVVDWQPDAHSLTHPSDMHRAQYIGAYADEARSLIS